MKNINLVIILTLILTACSTKSTSTPNNCQNIQNEIDNLKKENYTDMTAFTIKAVTGRYTFGGEKEKYLDQKLQILELKLSDCKRKVN